MAQFPFFTPLASFPVSSLSIPFYLLGIPPFAWCDPVHLGPRLLVNWPPPPHSIPIPSPFQFPNPPSFPKLIVRLTKTTSRSRLSWSGTRRNATCCHHKKTPKPVLGRVWPMTWIYITLLWLSFYMKITCCFFLRAFNGFGLRCLWRESKTSSTEYPI
jgi:hypothetical protein